MMGSRNWFDSLDSAQAILLDLEQDDDLQRASAALIDVEASSRWLAEVVPFLDKDVTGVFFIMAGQQADGWTVDEANHYWREQHFALAQTVEDYIVYLTRYEQMHGRDLPALRGTRLLGRYDFHPMSAQVGLRQAGDIATAFSLPSYLAVIRPDELKFAKQGEMLSFISTQRMDLG